MPFYKRIQALAPEEKTTFGYHMVYNVLEGIILGILALNEFVFLRSIGGSDLQVGILFQFSVMVLVLSVILNEWTQRVSNKKRFLLITGIVTRAPLLMMFIFPDWLLVKGHPGAGIYHSLFLAAFLTYYMASPIIYPVINLLLKTNYRHSNFGILYSYATTVNKIVMLLVTFLYGWLLDTDPAAYRTALPLCGILGMGSVAFLTRIPLNAEAVPRLRSGFATSVKGTFVKMRTIMKSNKAFRDFESGFMFYGFAFMGTVSVITVFYEQGLGLSYSSVAFYKNSYNLLAIVLLPFFGKLIGRTDPRKFAAITFASLLFYLLFIALTPLMPAKILIWDIELYYTLFTAMMFNGVFAATMSLLWSIGSAYFCRTEDSSTYQSIHLTFTGLRSFFAPVLGVYAYRWLGYGGAFAAGIVFLAIAVFISLRSYYLRPQSGTQVQETEPAPPGTQV